jgi:hypothetical protein
MPEGELTEQAWSRLGLYLSRDVIERRYEERHKRQLNAGKAREIIAHFEQGQQYFTSAQDAGALTSGFPACRLRVPRLHHLRLQ